MKNFSLFGAVAVLCLSASFLRSESKKEIPKPPVLASQHMDHVGIVVKDIDATLDHWVELLGLKTRPAINIASGDSKNPTQFRGKPTKAQAKLAFIDLDNIRLELIQPIGESPSHWREFLETKGEGVHHFGFHIEQLGETQAGLFKKHDYCLAQHGGWKTGEYGYMDTHLTKPRFMRKEKRV